MEVGAAVAVGFGVEVGAAVAVGFGVEVGSVVGDTVAAVMVIIRMDLLDSASVESIVVALVSSGLTVLIGVSVGTAVFQAGVTVAAAAVAVAEGTAVCVGTGVIVFAGAAVGFAGSCVGTAVAIPVGAGVRSGFPRTSAGLPVVPDTDRVFGPEMAGASVAAAAGADVGAGVALSGVIVAGATAGVSAVIGAGEASLSAAEKMPFSAGIYEVTG